MQKKKQGFFVLAAAVGNDIIHLPIEAAAKSNIVKGSGGTSAI